MKVGILGGSFNPIHLGHVEIAERVLKQSDLDEVWMVPALKNPFKDKYEVSFDDRCTMIRTTISNHPNIKCCTIEEKFDDGNQHYTYEMLKMLPSENEYYLIIGYDNWGKFPQWYKYREILKEFHVIVVSRPQYSNASFAYDHVTFLDLGDFPHSDASSTKIRQAIRNGEKPSDVNAIVEFIIRERCFYKKILV